MMCAWVCVLLLVYVCNMCICGYEMMYVCMHVCMYLHMYVIIYGKDKRANQYYAG